MMLLEFFFLRDIQYYIYAEYQLGVMHDGIIETLEL